MDQVLNKYDSFIKAQLDYLKKRNKKAKKVALPFITISRETGAFGNTISQGLSDYLNKKNKTAHCPWAVFNRNHIKTVTESKNLPETVKPYLLDSEIAEVDTTLKQIFNPHLPQHALVQSTCRSVLHLAQLGNVIIVGCAGNVLTRKMEGGFHIRLVSPFETRVEHIEEYYPMSQKEAKQFIYVEEGNRKEYLRKYFGRNIEDAHEYNMTINIDDFLEPEDVIKLIGDLICRKFELK